MYAAGKIPGGFIKREGRPTETATLTARLTDRPIRPLLPKQWRSEIQVTITTLSTDQETEPEILSIIGTSAAMLLSDLPFDGPVGAAKVGYINGEFVLNPTAQQFQESELELSSSRAPRMPCRWSRPAHTSSPKTSCSKPSASAGSRASSPSLAMQKQIAEELPAKEARLAASRRRHHLQDRVTDWLGTRLHDETTNKDKTVREDATDALKRRSHCNHFVELV